MRLHLITVAHKAPSWIEQGYQEYCKRLPREISVQLKTITPPIRNGRGDVPRAKQEEADKILAALPKQGWVVALDERGKSRSTQQWAEALQRWLQEMPDVSFIVGGADGLAQSVLDRTDECLSLSAMTFPHALVRVLLVEQVYRAWTVLQGHPYHRE